MPERRQTHLGTGIRLCEKGNLVAVRARTSTTVCWAMLWIAACSVTVLGCASTPAQDSTEATTPMDPIEQQIRMIEADPYNPESHYRLGNLYFDARQYRMALSSYDQAIAIKPDFAAAHCNRGLSLRNLGKNAEAIAAYKRALEIEPQDPITLSNLVAALRSVGDFEGALHYSLDLIKSTPEDRAALLDLAELLTHMNRHDDAAEVYQALIKLEPGQATLYARLGQCYFDMRDYDRSTTAWLTAIAYDPSNAEARRMLPQAYYRRGDFDKAWEAVTECQTRSISLDPDFIEALQKASRRVGPSHQ
ncbi:MAG: hypothetical protein AMXMBFR84_32860 [Candidatus Hydrogenedentota bacterium]